MFLWRPLHRELARDFNASEAWALQFPYLRAIASNQPCVPVHNNISDNTFCRCDTWISASAKDIASWHSTAHGNTNTTRC